MQQVGRPNAQATGARAADQQLWVTVQDGRVVEASPAFCSAFASMRAPPSEGVAESDIFVNPGDAVVLHQQLRSLGAVERLTTLMRDQHGKVRSCQVTAVRLPAPGRILAYQAVVRPASAEPADSPRVVRNKAPWIVDRALDATTEGIVITDPNLPDNPVVFVSAGFQRITGYEPGEVIGRNCRFMQTAETDPETVAEIRRAIAEQRPCAVELINARKNGERFWNRLSIAPIHDDGGRLINFIGVQLDVTESRAVQQALANRDAVLEAVSHVARSFLTGSDWERNINELLAQLGRVMHVSRTQIFVAGRNSLGHTAIRHAYEWSAPGVRPLAEMPEMQEMDLRALRMGGIEETMTHGLPVYGNVRNFDPPLREMLTRARTRSILSVPIRVDGQWWGFIGLDECAHERDWAAAEIDALFAAAGIVGAAIERRQSQNELDEKNAALRQAFDDLILAHTRESNEARRRELILRGIGDGVIVLDLRHQVSIMNDRAAALLNITAPTERDTPHTLREVFAGTHPDGEYICSLLTVAGPSEARELELETEGLQARTLKVGINPFVDEHGHVAGWVCILYDVTREREIDRMKTDFVSSVSHELRTPLTSIKGFTRAILQDPEMAGETQREFLRIVDEEADRLTSLIEDLLEISRIESGRQRIERAPIDLLAPLERTLSSMTPMMEEHGLVFESQVPAPLPRILADEAAVQRMLVNLLGNALKFTEPGGRVTLRAWAEGEEVAVAIEDTGMGIPPADLEHIFDRFYRVHRPGREIAGTGLGLPIVRDLLNRMDGRIQVRSTPRIGSCFTIWLPRARVETPAS